MNIKNKPIIILFTLILLCIISIGCVSATENTNTSNVSSILSTNNSQDNMNLKTTNNLEEINNSTKTTNYNQINTNNQNNNNNSNEIINKTLQTNTENTLLSNSYNIYISPYGTGSGNSINDPSNWNTAYYNIANGGTITFTSGTYYISNQNITKDLTLETEYNATVILDAQHSGCIFNLPNNNYKWVSLSLNGLTLINGNGYSYSQSSSDNKGGAINGYGQIYNYNTKYLGNTANYGGAICICGNLTDYNTQYINNYANSRGGAIEICNGDLKCIDSNFIGNKAPGDDNSPGWYLTGDGGAINSYNHGNIICTNTNFTNNTASRGGAIHTEGNIICNNNQFTNNFAKEDYSHGGAIWGYGNLTCIGSTFTNNKATGNHTYGGAINIIGNLICKDSTFTNNKATGNYSHGGAIYIYKGKLTTNDSSFTNNNVVYNGGAIYIEKSDITCSNTIFTNNSAFGNRDNYSIIGGYGGSLFIASGNLICEESTSFINNNDPNNKIIYLYNGTINCTNSKFFNNGNNKTYYDGIIDINYGNITCTNCDFNNNTFTPISADNGNVICKSCNFTNNEYGIKTLASNITCTDSIFINNYKGISARLGNIICNNITYINNTGAVEVDNGTLNCNNSNFIGNTAHDGTVFAYKGSINCTNSRFINNTAQYLGAAIGIEEGGDLICNYCMFSNNNGPNNNVIQLKKNGNCNVDYNWWGSNTPNNCNITINGELFKQTNTVYMSVLPTNINDKPNNEYTVNVILNQYMDSNGNLHNLDKNLPSVLVNLKANGGYLSNTNGYINEDNVFKTKYICPSNGGTYSISANIDNETLIIPVKIIGSSNPGIYGENLTMIYSTQQNYTGKLIGNNGEPLIGQHVSIKLSNSQGQSKIYYATTDNKGEYQLEINLYLGTYTAISSYDKYSCTNNIKVLKEASNLTSTTLTANTYQEPYGIEGNFTGKLTDNTGKALIGQHIALKLSNSQGQSKIYYSTTDVKGEYQLAINLYPGQYYAECTYAGTSVYDSSTNSASITVTN